MGSPSIRHNRLVAALVLLATLTGGAGIVGCGDDGGSQPLTEEEYVRAQCEGLVEFRDAGLAIVETLEPGEGNNAIFLEPFEDFVDRMRELEPPDSVAAWHKGWVADLEDNVERLKAGDPEAAPDPFDIGGPDLDPEVAARFEGIYQTTPACQELVPAEATPSPSPGRGQFPGPPQIDYSDPTAFLAGGPQSTFTDKNAAVVREEVGTGASEIEQAGLVTEWTRARFRGEPSGGATIGQTDVNGLMASRAITGCHDQALLVAAALRLYGIPALLADTAGIEWAEQFLAGNRNVYVGHVFVEAYIDGDWVIIECGSAQYTADYDTSNPVIPLQLGDESRGFYVLFKGLDPASYGVTEPAQLHRRMEAFGEALPALNLVFPDYSWQMLPGPGP
jgi:hypothetical protein